MKMTEKSRLWLFMALVIIVPALLNRVLPGKGHFNSKPIEQLKSKQPDLVLIGDSMLDSRVDADLLGQKLGGPVALIWNGGAASAWWYLVLKNYVLAADVHPKAVCFFFRDRLLTDASFRTTGTYRRYLDAVMHADEPVVRKVLDDRRAQGLERWASRLYPLNARRHIHHEKISRLVFRCVAINPQEAKRLERRVNKTFDLAKLRGDVTESTEIIGKGWASPFDPDPKKSFLPHIINLAARSHLRLCFVRTKRHPDAAGHVAQSDSLIQYVTELRAWLEKHGAMLIDETDNPAFTPDMYLKEKDDHIGNWAKPHSTEIYAEELRPLVTP